jgi:negative regulator of sigma E activity
VSFVGVLLLAVGLGVLIGHLGKNTSTPKGSASPPVTILQGGGSAATTAATTASTPTSTPKHINSASLTKKAQAKLKATTASKAVQTQATKAATKVLGSSNNLAPPTSTTGSKCSNGQAGCQNGKFTGNFFGP